MKVSPQTFFNFCAVHVPLLRALQERVGELSEADARRVIRDSGKADDELPETTWRRLRELQVLVPTEPGSDFYFLAEPVGRLLATPLPGLSRSPDPRLRWSRHPRVSHSLDSCMPRFHRPASASSFRCFGRGLFNIHRPAPSVRGMSSSAPRVNGRGRRWRVGHRCD